MASVASLTHSDDDFFTCPICLEQLKEPRLLPCLHRYCMDCLKTVIQASHDNTFNCSLCKQKYFVPKSGIEGFKADYHMKNMLEIAKLQRSFQNEELTQKCINCSQMQVATRYCFKCKYFLCESCYHCHLECPMFSDHQPHTLKLEYICTKYLKLEKLVAFIDNPMCHEHEKEYAQSCCSSCRNLPVCVTCTSYQHKGHDLYDVIELAESERKLLKQKLASLNIQKRKFYNFSRNTQVTLQKLFDNAAETIQTLQIQHEEEVNMLKDRLLRNAAEYATAIGEIKRRLRKLEEIPIKITKKGSKLERLGKKYDQITEPVKGNYEQEYLIAEINYNNIESYLKKKLGRLTFHFKKLTIATEISEKQNENRLRTLINHCEYLETRYLNLKATVSSIFAAKDDWTYTQCIPDIRSACEALIAEMGQIEVAKDKLEQLSEIIVNDSAILVPDDVPNIELEVSSVMNIEGFRDNGWKINGMASIGCGTIIVTGRATNKLSYILAITSRGNVLQEYIIQNDSNTGIKPMCFCSSWVAFIKSLIVCRPCKLITYDVRCGTFKTNSIADLIGSWPLNRYVTCVASSDVNNHIFVGTNSRDVYVFDELLMYKKVSTLPDVIIFPCDITVHRGSQLLVCDYRGKRAYSVTDEVPKSRLIYEFPKPGVGRGDPRGPGPPPFQKMLIFFF